MGYDCRGKGVRNLANRVLRILSITVNLSNIAENFDRLLSLGRFRQEGLNVAILEEHEAYVNDNTEDEDDTEDKDGDDFPVP